MSALGVDFGTAYVRGALWCAESPTLLEEEGGRADVPALVALDGGRILAGRAAHARAALRPDSTIMRMKRLLGRAPADPRRTTVPPPGLAIDRRSGAVRFRLGDETIAPEDAIAPLFAHLATLAERQCDERPTRVVISVPCWLEAFQREALRAGAKLAGFDVVKFVSDERAAALAWVSREVATRTIAIIDAGSGGVYASILKVSPTRVDRLATRGDCELGGDDVDGLLAQLVTDDLVEQLGGIGDDPMAAELLLRACEEMKRELGEIPNASRHVPVPMLGRGIVMRDVTLDRARLDDALGDLVEHVEVVCLRALAAAGMAPGEVDAAYALGGMMEIATVRAAAARAIGRELTAAPPVRAPIAVGAALHGGIALEGRTMPHPPRAVSTPASHRSGELIPPPIAGKRSAPFRPPSQSPVGIPAVRTPTNAPSRPGANGKPSAQPVAVTFSSVPAASSRPISMNESTDARRVSSSAVERSLDARGSIPPPRASMTSNLAPAKEWMPGPTRRSESSFVGVDLEPSGQESAPTAGVTTVPPLAVTSRPPHATTYAAGPIQSKSAPTAGFIPGSESTPSRPGAPGSWVGVAPPTRIVPPAGRFAPPRDALALLGLPIAHPRSQATPLGAPETLPVLLLDLVARNRATGTLLLTRTSEPLRIHCLDGAAYLNKIEHAALVQAFSWGEGTYAFEEGASPTGVRRRTTMVSLVAEGIRVIGRDFDRPELEAAFGEKLDRAPLLTTHGHGVIDRLALLEGELRLARHRLDGTEPARRLVQNGGVGAKTTLVTLAILHLFDLLEWREITHEREVPLADRLALQAETMEYQNHFEALGVHWSSVQSEIEAAYRDCCRRVESSDCISAAPEACRRIRRRADAAYRVLQDPLKRVAYRREVYSLDFEAMADLADSRANALLLKGASLEAASDRQMGRELARTQRPRVMSPVPHDPGPPPASSSSARASDSKGGKA